MSYKYIATTMNADGKIDFPASQCINLARSYMPITLKSPGEAPKTGRMFLDGSMVWDEARATHLIHFPPNTDASSIIQVSLLPVGKQRTERCYAIIKRDGKECRCKHLVLRGIYCGQHLSADKGEDALD